MASKRPTILKRERERKLADRAAQKRDKRARRGADRPEPGDGVATHEDLEGYGIARPLRDDRDAR
jgi:hypothetical protein